MTAFGVQIITFRRNLADIDAVVHTKQLGQLPNGFTLQTNSGILPVPEPYHLINIFIRDIHAAGIADFSVNYQNLSVAAVVALEPGKRRCLNTEGTQGFMVVPRQGGHASHIVVQYPHFHTGM